VIVLATVPLHEVAGAYERGSIVDAAAGSGRFTDAGGTMTAQPPAGPTAYFPRLHFDGGFKLIHERIMQFGGRKRGRPFAPGTGRGLLRPRANRGPMNAGPGVQPRTAQPPAGLLATGPWWEDYLTGSGGYLS